MKAQIHISFVSTNAYFYYIKMRTKTQVEKPQKYKYILMYKLRKVYFCIPFMLPK